MSVASRRISRPQRVRTAGEAPALSARVGRPGKAPGRRVWVTTSRRVAGFLSNRLLKFHVTGTIRNPSVALDPGVQVNDSAVSFFLLGRLQAPDRAGLVKLKRNALESAPFSKGFIRERPSSGE